LEAAYLTGFALEKQQVFRSRPRFAEEASETEKVSGVIHGQQERRFPSSFRLFKDPGNLADSQPH
jgi:hypothetical protein